MTTLKAAETAPAVPILQPGTTYSTQGLTPRDVAVTPTQVRRPWRSTIRTIFQALVMLALIAPAIYSAAAQHSPEQATGWAALGLAIAGGVTRVMALPAVEEFLRRFVPFLAAAPQPAALNPKDS